MDALKCHIAHYRRVPTDGEQAERRMPELREEVKDYRSGTYFCVFVFTLMFTV